VIGPLAREQVLPEKQGFIKPPGPAVQVKFHRAAQTDIGSLVPGQSKRRFLHTQHPRQLAFNQRICGHTGRHGGRFVTA
jgi:hypothetical protein